MLIPLICLSVLVPSALAKFEFGACPTVFSGQWPFSMSQFEGKWFMKHSLDTESQRCITWNFELNNSTGLQMPRESYTIRNTGINLRSNNLEFHDGTAVWKDPNGSMESELLVSFSDDGWGQSARDYMILATNYNSYALVYSCTTQFWFFRSRNAWILTRERTNATLNSILLILLENYNLKTTDFQDVRQDNC